MSESASAGSSWPHRKHTHTDICSEFELTCGLSFVITAHVCKVDLFLMNTVDGLGYFLDGSFLAFHQDLIHRVNTAQCAL